MLPVHPLRFVLPALVVLGLAASPAHAVINPGQSAPAFTKNVLNSTPWATATLSQFSGQVLILHILGYD